MSVHDHDPWAEFDDLLKRELGSTIADENPLASRVTTRIAGRSPRRLRRDHDERRMRHLTFAAAMVFGGLVLFHAGADRTTEPVEDEVPAVVEFESEVEEDVSDSTSILASLLFDRRRP